MDNPWIPAFWNSSTDYPLPLTTPGARSTGGGGGSGVQAENGEGGGWGCGTASVVLRSWKSVNLAVLVIPPTDMFYTRQGIHSIPLL